MVMGWEISISNEKSSVLTSPGQEAYVSRMPSIEFWDQNEFAHSPPGIGGTIICERFLSDSLHQAVLGILTV